MFKSRSHIVSCLLAGLALAAGTGVAQGQDAMFVDSSGNVGVGTNTPAFPLHVLRSDATGAVRVEESSANTTLSMFQLVNNGQPRFQMTNTGLGESWFFSAFSNRFEISFQGSGGSEFEVFKNGTLKVGPGSATNLFVKSTGDVEMSNGDLFVGGEVTATAFNTSSSVTVKDQITPVDTRTILAKLETLPIQEWSYRENPASRHIGPMAEDFSRLFNLGPDNRHITPTDLAGVALSAAQQLQKENEAKDRKIAELERRIERLEAFASQ